MAVSLLVSLLFVSAAVAQTPADVASADAKSQSKDRDDGETKIVIVVTEGAAEVVGEAKEAVLHTGEL